jgi:hypothetical protein
VGYKNQFVLQLMAPPPATDRRWSCHFFEDFESQGKTDRSTVIVVDSANDGLAECDLADILTHPRASQDQTHRLDFATGEAVHSVALDSIVLTRFRFARGTGDTGGGGGDTTINDHPQPKTIRLSRAKAHEARSKKKSRVAGTNCLGEQANSAMDLKSDVVNEFTINELVGIACITDRLSVGVPPQFLR